MSRKPQSRNFLPVKIFEVVDIYDAAVKIENAMEVSMEFSVLLQQHTNHWPDLHL